MEAFKEFLGITSNIEAFYWIVALFATFSFLIKILISFFAGDSDSDTNTHPDDSIISFNTVLSFLKVAGWIGVICYRLTLLAPITIFFVSVSSGIFAFIMVGLLLRKVKRFESYGTLNLENAIGKIGTVYLSIPANSNGEGQIQIEVQGRLTTLDAKSVGEEIKTGRKVLVYDVKDGKLLVSPYKDIDLEINSN